MTAQFLTLEIGSLVIPASAMGRLRVEYEDLEARTDRRTAAGSFNSRSAGWTKLRATISGDGFGPPGLDGLDLDATHTVALPKQAARSSASNVIALPAARRSGGLYQPLAFAVVDGHLVSTPVAVVTDTATCTTVPGASGYRVDYFPSITGHVRIAGNGLDSERARHGWQIVIEES